VSPGHYRVSGQNDLPSFERTPKFTETTIGPNTHLCQDRAQVNWSTAARLHPLLLKATVCHDKPTRRFLDRDRVGGPICYIEATELDRLFSSDPNLGRSTLRHRIVNAVVVQKHRGHQRLGPREEQKNT